MPSPIPSAASGAATNVDNPTRPHALSRRFSAQPAGFVITAFLRVITNRIKSAKIVRSTKK
jgi:hypothetical protein